MRKYIFGYLLIASSAVAEHDSSRNVYAKVTHVEPIYEQVAYHQPRERCWEQTVAHRRGGTTAPILGAIIGGALGNELGHHKSNKKVGAFVGAALGASIAADVARRQQRTDYHVEQHCEIVDDTEYRQEVVGYHVTYRYHGAIYHTRLPYHPGERIRVRVEVTPLG